MFFIFFRPIKGNIICKIFCKSTKLTINRHRKRRNFAANRNLVTQECNSSEKKRYLCSVKDMYHRDIVGILLDSGRNGIRLCRIARKVYNMHVDLFNADLNYYDLRTTIGRYLWRETQKPESMFTHREYGVYALKNNAAIQLDLFWDQDLTNSQCEDLSPEKEKAVPAPNAVQLELF